MNRPVGMDDQMASVLYSGEPPAVHVLAMIRPEGEPNFLPRTRRLLRVFHHEVGRHYGRTLRRRAVGPFDAYPRRLRQTLRCLLEGDSEKQAAARLGLSRHTVHGYVLELYRRLDVASRAELMAYCLRHRVSPDDAGPPVSKAPRLGPPGGAATGWSLTSSIQTSPISPRDAEVERRLVASASVLKIRSTRVQRPTTQ